MWEFIWNNSGQIANFLAILAALWGVTRTYHNKIEKRFDTIEKKFDAIDKRFDTIEKKLDDLDKKYDVKCSHLSNRIDDLYHLIVTYLFKEKVQ